MKEKTNLLGIHLASFVVNLSGLEETDHKRFTELVTELVAAIDEGHSCLSVAEDDRVLLAKTRLVSKSDQTPLILDGDSLYLHRYYRYESRLAAQIKRLASETFEIENYQQSLELAFGKSDGVDFQRSAAELALQKSLCIISGGPGTGKTSTVARIIALLLQVLGIDCKVALAAPTGKAAMRLRQSVMSSVESLSFPEEITQAIPDQAATLHRLLGVKKYSPQFRHNKENPMEWEVVVVDEASMVDLALMSKLVDALKPGARLILLGDKDQLVSVESGSVLADLIESLPQNTVILKKSYRFDEAIKSLAEAVNDNNHTLGWSLLNGQSCANIGILQSSMKEYISGRYRDYWEYVKGLKREEYNNIFQMFNRFRVLCAIRSGRYGIEGINNIVEKVLRRERGHLDIWYTGRPVMIQRNDYGLDLYNGDVGICLPDPDDDNRLKVWFEVSDGDVKPFLPLRLPQCETVYGMTIHKSQGSEFEEVLIILPEEDSQILSRELIYTAITRARKTIKIKCNRTVWELALSRKTIRQSGLAAMIHD